MQQNTTGENVSRPMASNIGPNNSMTHQNSNLHGQHGVFSSSAGARPGITSPSGVICCRSSDSTDKWTYQSQAMGAGQEAGYANVAAYRDGGSPEARLHNLDGAGANARHDNDVDSAHASIGDVAGEIEFRGSIVAEMANEKYRGTQPRRPAPVNLGNRFHLQSVNDDGNEQYKGFRQPGHLGEMAASEISPGQLYSQASRRSRLGSEDETLIAMQEVLSDLLNHTIYQQIQKYARRTLMEQMNMMDSDDAVDDPSASDTGINRVLYPEMQGNESDRRLQDINTVRNNDLLSQRVQTNMTSPLRQTMTSVKKATGRDLLSWGLEGIQQPESTADYQESLRRAMQSGVVTEELRQSKIREPASKSFVISQVSGVKKPRRIQPSEKMKQLEEYERTMDSRKALSVLKMDGNQEGTPSYDSEEDLALDDCSPQEVSTSKMPLATQPNMDDYKHKQSLLIGAHSEHLQKTPSVQNYRNFQEQMPNHAIGQSYSGIPLGAHEVSQTTSQIGRSSVSPSKGLRSNQQLLDELNGNLYVLEAEIYEQLMDLDQIYDDRETESQQARYITQGSIPPCRTQKSDAGRTAHTTIDNMINELRSPGSGAELPPQQLDYFIDCYSGLHAACSPAIEQNDDSVQLQLILNFVQQDQNEIEEKAAGDEMNPTTAEQFARLHECSERLVNAIMRKLTLLRKIELKQGRSSIFVQGDLDFQQLIGTAHSEMGAVPQGSAQKDICGVSYIKNNEISNINDDIAQSEGAPQHRLMFSPRQDNAVRVKEDWGMPPSREQSKQDADTESQKHSLFKLDVSHVTNKAKQSTNKPEVELSTAAAVAEISVSPAPVPNTVLKTEEDNSRNSPDLPDQFLRQASNPENESVDLSGAPLQIPVDEDHSLNDSARLSQFSKYEEEIRYQLFAYEDESKIGKSKRNNQQETKKTDKMKQMEMSGLFRQSPEPALKKSKTLAEKDADAKAQKKTTGKKSSRGTVRGQQERSIDQVKSPRTAVPAIPPSPSPRVADDLSGRSAGRKSFKQFLTTRQQGKSDLSSSLVIAPVESTSVIVEEKEDDIFVDLPKKEQVPDSEVQKPIKDTSVKPNIFDKKSPRVVTPLVSKLKTPTQFKERDDSSTGERALNALLNHQASVENLLVKERLVKKEEPSSSQRKNRLAEEADKRYQQHQLEKQRQEEAAAKSFITDDSMKPRRSRRIDIKEHGYDDKTLLRTRKSVDRVLTGSFLPRATVAEELRAKANNINIGRIQSNPVTLKQDDKSPRGTAASGLQEQLQFNDLVSRGSAGSDLMKEVEPAKARSNSRNIFQKRDSVTSTDSKKKRFLPKKTHAQIETRKAYAQKAEIRKSREAEVAKNKKTGGIGDFDEQSNEDSILNIPKADSDSPKEAEEKNAIEEEKHVGRKRSRRIADIGAFGYTDASLNQARTSVDRLMVRGTSRFGGDSSTDQQLDGMMRNHAAGLRK